MREITTIVNSEGHIQGWWHGDWVVFDNPWKVRIRLMESVAAARTTMGVDRDPMETAAIREVEFLYRKMFWETGLFFIEYLVSDDIPADFWDMPQAHRLGKLTFS